ncbi:MAG: phosphatidylserine decarboxylase [Pseudomonadota bacterium]
MLRIKKSTLHAATLCSAITLPVLGLSGQALADESPCAGSLAYLEQHYTTDQVVRDAFDQVYAGLVDLPESYTYGGSSTNPWKSAGSGKGLYLKMNKLFRKWCVEPPQIEGTSDNALDPILYFAWVYYKNQAGVDFVQGRNPSAPRSTLAIGPEFLNQWNAEYRQHMDSPESAKVVSEWIQDPRIEIKDYVKTKPKQYKSWNEFFARNLKTDEQGNYPSRPVTMPEREYTIVSPTDCIMNPLVQVLEYSGAYQRQFLDNPLQLNTVLDVKHIPISVHDMLGSLPDDLKQKFVGGHGLSCVLMPNTYHHFHAPVDGKVIHAEIVKTGTAGTPSVFGYPDFPNWVPTDGNVGRAGTDFSQFQAFQRGVIVTEVKYKNLPGKWPETLTGYVASIPVGLNSVGSVVLNTCDSKDTDQVNCFQVGGKVQKGKTKFGNFFFGGSLNILLFSKGMLSPAVQTRMGNQIGIINVGSAPKSPWSLDGGSH